MRNSSIVAKSGTVALGQFTGGPARNNSSSVGIRIGGVQARHAMECRLVRAALFGHMAALGALTARVPWIYDDQRDARKPRLVCNKCAQLSKRPAMENGALLPASPYPGANASEFLNGDTAPGAFGGSNDLLGNNVVFVAGKSPLLAGDFLQSPLCGAGLLFIKFGAQATVTVPHGLHGLAAVRLAIGVAGNIGDAKVHAEECTGLDWFGIGYLAGSHQIPLAAHQSQIGFAFSVGKYSTLPPATDKWNTQAALDGPNGDGGFREFPGQNTVVVGGSSARAKSSHDGLVEFIGVRHFSNGMHGGLRRQPKPLTDVPVAFLLQCELAKYFRLPRVLADPITRGVECDKSASQGVRLLGRSLQFQFCRKVQVEDSSMRWNHCFCKAKEPADAGTEKGNG